MNSRVALAAHILNFSAARVGVGALTVVGTFTTRRRGGDRLLADVAADEANLQWRRNLHIKTADAFDWDDDFEE